MKTEFVLSTAYLPPVQYMTKLLSGIARIEKHENYQKQSYRNRCCIYGANGVQCLVIPVRKNHGSKSPVTEIEIDYATNWQHVHLKSIQSAYQLSPFYEFYADSLEKVILENNKYLYELNMQLIKLVLYWMGIKEMPLETSSWQESYANDFRNSINPKQRLSKPDDQFRPVPYQQVFIDRYGFIPNLSIIDLLFNEGPESVTILRKSFT